MSKMVWLYLYSITGIVKLFHSIIFPLRVNQDVDRYVCTTKLIHLHATTQPVIYQLAVYTCSTQTNIQLFDQ